MEQEQTDETPLTDESLLSIEELKAATHGTVIGFAEKLGSLGLIICPSGIFTS